MPYILRSATPPTGVAAPPRYTARNVTWAELKQRLDRVQAHLWHSQVVIISAEALLSQAEERLHPSSQPRGSRRGHGKN